MLPKTCLFDRFDWLLSAANNIQVPNDHVLYTSQPPSPVNLPYQPPSSPKFTQRSNSISQKSDLASGPSVTSDENWQAQKSSVRDRNAAMFNNELMSDIHFSVGVKGSMQHIPAHKYVLATGSTVFYAMFYGGLANDDDEIEIPDVEPSAFVSLLR